MDRSGSLIGAGGVVMSSAGSADNCKSLTAFGPCLNARASVVSKQVGADPHLPGPGQCKKSVLLFNQNIISASIS